ncbi:hypothetical protein ACTWP5_18875 [Streptomyces sp. 4N509B]|uniref:hypothetical protein n=1 Tax=Streptomyces sp. 4N509B TaxID=3457413 RepID=UPI003FD482AC
MTAHAADNAWLPDGRARTTALAAHFHDAGTTASYDPVAEQAERKAANAAVVAYQGAGAIRHGVELDTTQARLVRRDGTVPLRVDVGDAVVLDDSASGLPATPKNRVAP